MTISLPRLTTNDEIRVWANILRTDPNKCWPWVLSKSTTGYPRIRIQHNTFKVSRIVFLIHYGFDPGNLHVLHDCDNPVCCNPDHLYVGTDQDNVKDMEDRGRSWCVKMTPEDILFAVAQRNAGSSYRAIATALRKNHSTVIHYIKEHESTRS